MPWILLSRSAYGEQFIHAFRDAQSLSLPIVSERFVPQTTLCALRGGVSPLKDHNTTTLRACDPRLLLLDRQCDFRIEAHYGGCLGMRPPLAHRRIVTGCSRSDLWRGSISSSCYSSHPRPRLCISCTNASWPLYCTATIPAIRAAAIFSSLSSTNSISLAGTPSPSAAWR